MRASLRYGLLAFAAGLWLVPTSASSQAAQPTSNTPATDAVGPRELQNFSLNGRVTQQAEPPSQAPAPATAPSATRRQREAATSTSQPAAERATEQRQPSRQAAADSNGAASPAPRSADSQSALALDLATAPQAPSQASAQPAFTPDAEPEPEVPAPTLAPDRRAPLWPWLLAAVVLGGAGAWFLRHRKHSREAFAGGPQVDAYVAPEPPTPAPRAAPPAAAPQPPKPTGLVSSGLRPWLDIEFVPLQCLVEDDKVTFQFEVGLLNSGGAVARDILVEASIYNAGPSQDEDIRSFFGKGAGPGERIPVIPPLQRFAVQSQLVAPRANIQAFDVGGRQVFVPLVAFNVSYRTSSREGRTSAAFMLGRESGSEKLAPLRLDLGQRAYAGLGSRALPISVRK